MSLLIESLKIEGGRLFNVGYHNKRMNAARRILFGCSDEIDLSDYIKFQDQKGLVKCRVLYNKNVQKIQYDSYKLPTINSLKLLSDNRIDYSYKFEDRAYLKSLYEKKEDADDILILKDGEVTDTYFCNVIFEKKDKLFTPSSYLLNGTKRQYLLDQKRIVEMPITINNMFNFERIRLINAMIDLEDDIFINIEDVVG